MHEQSARLKRPPIRLHVFFRKPRALDTYSIERLFDAILSELPRERFAVQRLVCPFYSRGVVRRMLLMLWAAAHQGDINHITGDVDFLCLLMHRSRTLITVHDTATLRRLSGWRRYLYTLFWVRLPLVRAGRVTVVSEFTRREVQTAAASFKGRIEVVPNCATIPIDRWSKPFNSVRPRILQVGTKPNKNLGRVTAALTDVSCVLVIIGELSSPQRVLLNRHRVVYENYVGVSDYELRAQYQAADLVIFASTYEGFGLPILEAQAAGRPVVTSDQEPFRSVAGRGAVLVDPNDTKSIRRGVESVIDDAVLRSRLELEGYRNVVSHQPEAIATLYSAIYADMAEDLFK
jgi:glycosyltransferase involved in cell wall biosynthesis